MFGDEIVEHQALLASHFGDHQHEHNRWKDVKAPAIVWMLTHAFAPQKRTAKESYSFQYLMAARDWVVFLPSNPERPAKVLNAAKDNSRVDNILKANVQTSERKMIGV